MLVIVTRKMLYKISCYITGEKDHASYISVRDLSIQLDSLPSFDEHIDVTTLENVISSLVFLKLLLWLNCMV